VAIGVSAAFRSAIHYALRHFDGVASCFLSQLLKLRPVAASSSSNEIDPALLERLGRVVYQWAFVEMVQGMFLAFLLHADQGLVHMVTTNISGTTLTDWIRTLVPIRFKDATTQENIRDLLRRIDEARAERNTLVHGMWSVGNAPRTVFVSTIGWERAEVMTNRLIRVDDFDGLLEEIGAIYDELVWLGKQAGFYTMPAPTAP
jgi:hypothetical protein